jgi:3-hydroxybutyryl-CoA dehydratase
LKKIGGHITQKKGINMSEIRKKAIEGVKANDIFTAERTFTEQDVMQFADITRDYNPCHLDGRFTAVKKLNGRICHGLLVASLMTQIGGQMGWLASRFDLHFKKPVYFGDTITCTVTLKDIDEKGRVQATAGFVNQEGTTVLQASLEGNLAGQAEIEVLKAMLAEGDPTNKFNG